MFSYFAHGLKIASEVRFPELSEIEQEDWDVDLIIRFGYINPPTLKKDFREFSCSIITKARVIDDITYIYRHNIELFAIKDGRQIIINHNNDLEDSFLRLHILGNAIPIALHQRRRLILHANAVNIDGGAVVFLGPSGSGKSTISLALHDKGHSLVSDDVLSVEVNDLNITAFHSFPRIKLWPEVIIEYINENPELTPQLFSSTDKRSYMVETDLDSPIPLKTIYIIEKGNKTCIELINPEISVMGLIKNSYLYGFFENYDLANNLRDCAKIVNQIPVKKFTIKHSFDDIPKIIKMIEKDILG